MTKFIKEHAVVPYELKKKADVEAVEAAEAQDTSDSSDAPEPAADRDEL